MASQSAFDPDLDHDDRGPLALVVTWVWTALATIILLLRIYCKLVRRHVNLWWDDWVLIASWAVLVAGSGVTTKLIALGNGKHDWDFPPENIGLDMVLVLVRSTLTSITAVCWAKTAFAITLLRLTVGWKKWLVWFAIVSSNIFAIVCGLLVWVVCLPIPTDLSKVEVNTCVPTIGLMYFYFFVGAYSGLLDFVLALLGWNVVWSLNLKLRRTEKIGVAAAMSMGFFAGVTAIIKTAMLHNQETNDSYYTLPLWYWDTAEVAVTIIAASMPTLRVLFRDITSDKKPQAPAPGGLGASLQSRFRRMRQINQAHRLDDLTTTVTSTVGGGTTTQVTGPMGSSRHDNEDQDRGLLKPEPLAYVPSATSSLGGAAHAV